jgi:hypothetical protein
MDVSHLDIARVVQSALAPVFLISGVASSLIVLTNRLARVVDRARMLEARMDSLTQQEADPLQLDAELRVLSRRAFYINTAISMCAVSVVLVTLVVVALFATAFFDGHMAETIAVLFVGAMLFLTAAFLAFLIEVGMATSALNIGIRARSASAVARSSHLAADSARAAAQDSRPAE